MHFRVAIRAAIGGHDDLVVSVRGMTRAAFQKRMAERGIGIGVHYPCIPGLTYYRQRGYRAEDTPVAARVGRETVTLPLFPAMQDEDVTRVCRALVEVLGF